VKNVQKVLDGKTGACQNGLTDRRNSDGQASKCFKSSKKCLTRNRSCAKLASLIQAAPAAPQEQQKVLDRQKKVCETGFTEQNATTGSKSSKKCLTAEAKRVKLAALNEQTNPGTARRASLKEHYHDCNHQKRPG
jgi:hypothetical protein